MMVSVNKYDVEYDEQISVADSQYIMNKDSTGNSQQFRSVN